MAHTLGLSDEDDDDDSDESTVTLSVSKGPASKKKGDGSSCCFLVVLFVLVGFAFGIAAAAVYVLQDKEKPAGGNETGNASAEVKGGGNEKASPVSAVDLTSDSINSGPPDDGGNVKSIVNLMTISVNRGRAAAARVLGDFHVEPPDVAALGPNDTTEVEESPRVTSPPDPVQNQSVRGRLLGHGGFTSARHKMSTLKGYRTLSPVPDDENTPQQPGGINSGQMNHSVAFSGVNITGPTKRSGSHDSSGVANGFWRNNITH